MIYVLFGPPGVGKTYIGQLAATKFGYHFFDADFLYDDELKHLLRSGNYTQEVRDRFVEKLVATTESILAQGVEDLVIAEAFTKEKNRFEFLRHFDNQVCYIMVRATKEVAKKRMEERLTKGEHVVDDYVFEFVWDEFESPAIPYRALNNENNSEEQIMTEFTNVVELCKKEFL